MSAIRKRRVEIIDVDIDEAKKQLAALITKARKAKGMTQETFATVINISRGQVANLETGRTWVSFEQFLRIMYALDLTISKDTFS